MSEQELKEIKTAVTKELCLAAEGQKSSFPFIQNNLPQKKPLSNGTKIQVLVIGGSVFKKGIFVVGDHLQLIEATEQKQPVFDTKEDFLDFCLKNTTQDIPLVAVNFAYPLKPVARGEKLDGKLLSGMKENRFAGLVGENVGEELERYLGEKLRQTFSVNIANDTVCLLLSGLSFTSSANLVAGVIGTGVNIAFFKDTGSVINTEAANFNKFSLSEEAIVIDKKSAAPSHALFEKEMAGGYLYQHYNYYQKKYPISSTEELDTIATKETSDGALARQLLTRSAELAATLIAGVVEYKQLDLTFVIEGSLFWKGYHYKTTVERMTQKLLTAYSVRFLKIEDSPLFGGAYLAY